MRRFGVVVGVAKPGDPSHKSRPCLVLCENPTGGGVLLPFTTHPARTGEVPRGHVLLCAKDSPEAHRASGCVAPVVSIGVKDAFRATPKELSAARRIGSIDFTVDARLAARFWAVMREHLSIMAALAAG